MEPCQCSSSPTSACVHACVRSCASVWLYIIYSSVYLSVLTVCVIQVPRHAGPPYTAHDITKGHPNLAGTPPGHAHSPALSQVSVPTASPYRYPKGWEAGGGVSLSLCPPSSSLHISVCLLLFLRLVLGLGNTSLVIISLYNYTMANFHHRIC